MRIAVCEDDKADLHLLQKELDLLGQELPVETKIDYYTSGEALTEAVGRNVHYDLFLLDIYLDGMDGIETARAIRRMLPEMQVAFLTSARDFALDAFDLNAIHYLIKPINIEKLRELVRRFLKYQHRPEKYLENHSDTKKYTFPLAQVQKIQSSNKGVDVYLSDIRPPQRIPLSLKRVEEQLYKEYFLKISRGLIVHMSYILCMDKNVCRFRDGTSALISRGEKAAVRKKYNDYLFSRSQKGVFL